MPCLFDDSALAAHIERLQGQLPKRLMPKRAKRRTTKEESEMSAERITGTIKFFNSEKSYGFITKTGEAESTVFLGGKAIEESGLSPASIKKGTPLSFAVQQRAKGPAAIDIKLLADDDKPATTSATARARAA